MTTVVPNSAPMNYFEGIKDESTRELPIQAVAIPAHLPKIWLYAMTGPTTPTIVSGSDALRIYGDATLNPRSAYANHATMLAITLFGAPNKCVIHRVIPDDAGPKATIRLSLDVLETQVPVYQRRSDGSIALDQDGLPVTTGTTTTGRKVKWVAEQVPVIQGVDNFGAGTEQNGDQVDVLSSTQSRRIPVMDVRVPHFGKEGNNAGLRLWAPTNTGISPMDARTLTEEKFYPFQIACLHRKDELSTPKLVATTGNQQSIAASFKPGALLRATETEMYVGDTFIPAYQNLESLTNPPQWGPFGEVFVYEEKIADLVEDFYRVEAPHATAFSDFGTSVADSVVEANKYMINLISAVSSQNVPYTAIQFVTTGNFVHLSNSSVIYARGGSDGTMNDAKFAELVSAEVVEYNNPNSELLESATHPENIIYDSGFPLQTKYDLFNFIAIRKDTNLGIATFDASGREHTPTEETSIGMALATKARLHPESTYHGTQTCRVFIMTRSGKLLNSQWKKPLPVLFDVAYKYAQYMGADDGKWKPGYRPNKSPRNIVSTMRDFNATFTPSSSRQNDWSIGLNWLMPYDERRAYIPALRTVYQDETSVLTSVTTMFACSRLQRIGEGIHKDYVGRDDLTKSQLRSEIAREVQERTQGLFEDRYVIQGEVIFTAEDDLRGYSWGLAIHIWANNMRTVQILRVVAHRMEDLQETTT